MLLSELLSKSEDAVHKSEKKKKRKLAESWSIKTEKKKQGVIFWESIKEKFKL